MKENKNKISLYQTGNVAPEISNKEYRHEIIPYYDNTTLREAMFLTGTPEKKGKKSKSLLGQKVTYYKHDDGQLAMLEVLKANDDKPAKFNVRTHQILMLISHGFSNVNKRLAKKVFYVDKETGQHKYLLTEKPDKIENEIAINIKETARAMNFNIEDKDQLKNARRLINAELNRIFNSYFYLFDKKYINKRSHVLQSEAETINGFKVLKLTEDFCDYLIEHSQFARFDSRMLKIDGNDPNTYIVGNVIINQWDRVNPNTKDPVPYRNRLSIKTLLKKLSIVSYRQVLETRQSWYQKIKIPLENILNKLVEEYQIITSWNYGRPNNDILSQEENNNIDSYADFENLLIYFHRDIDHSKNDEKEG